MNTGNGSIDIAKFERRFSGMGACWQTTAGFWYEKLQPQGTKRKQTPNEGGVLVLNLLASVALIEGAVPPCDEGTRYPHPGSCSDYLECRNGVTLKKSCPEGTRFHERSTQCRPKTDVNCPRKCVEYELRYVEDNCVEYKICVEGEMVKRTCKPNTYFNRFKMECQLGDPLTCFKICYWKGKKPVKDSCTEYDECFDNRERRKTCPPGHKFHKGTGECRSSETVDCQEIKCEEQQRRPAEFNCYSYEECNGGKFVKKYCEQSRMFDKTTLTCRHAPPGYFCSNASQGMPEEKCTENGRKRPVDENCIWYEECVAGNLIKKRCPEGSALDEASGECKPANAVVCAAKCEGFERRPSKGKCSPEYEECRDGVFVAKTCLLGKVFDNVELTCRRPSEIGCTHKCSEGEKKPIPGKWEQFEMCVGGEVVVKSCRSMQRFDTEEKDCVFSIRAQTAKCNFGENIAVENSCTDYRQCSLEGKFEGPFSCRAEGGVYDEQKGACRPRRPADCPLAIWQDGKCIEGTSRTVNEDCSEFEECVGGKIVKKSCDGGWPFGKRWDIRAKECKWKWNVDCPQCSQNDRRAVEDSCTEFEECHGGEWERASCGWPGAVFDKKTKECVEPEALACSWSAPADGSCPDGGARPVASRCNLYDECQDSRRSRKSCAFGLGFDRYSKRCVPLYKARCQPSECSGSIRQGDYQDCSGYYECDAGQYVRKSCSFLKRFDVNKKECVAGLIVECAQKPIF